VRRGTEHNKYLSRLFAGCDLFAEWHASFVSGMMVRLVDSSNISASHHYCASRGSGVHIEPRPILQLMNVLAALVEFRIKQSSVLLHQAAVLHVAVIGNASFIVGSTHSRLRWS
jgi:hypothetical protein